MHDINFQILIRKPKYPLIIISLDNLYSAYNIRELAKYCGESALIEGEACIKAIDSSGEEFWYSPEKYVITPGFFCKKWTKKKIVELYNGRLNKDEKEKQYSTKSLSAKRLEKIILDICNLMNK